MKKFVSLMLCTVLAGCISFALVGCADDDKSDKNNNGNETSVNIEGFNLAKTPAQINIVTDDGTGITGTPTYQPYKECTVGVEKGRDGENFSPKRAQVRIRGNNTAEYDKKSFRIKFDEKTNLLGLNGGKEFKNWVLLACYKDVSFLRDAVMFELAKQTLAENGLYSSDYGFAEVTVNGNYNGFYLVAEQQQVNENRININEPAENYTGTDIGYLIEYDGNASMTEPSDRWFRLTYNENIYCEDGTPKRPGQAFDLGYANYTVKNDFYSSAQTRYIENYTANVYKIIYDAIYYNKYTTFNSDCTQIISSSFTNSRATIEAVVNIDSVIDSFIIAEVACDNDIDWSSWFFTVDMSATGDKKLTFQAPWDSDSGFGMMDGLEQLDKIFTANAYTNSMHGLNPWTAVFFEEEWFREAVAERWFELKEKGAFTRLISLIDGVTESYKANFDKNYELWDNLGRIVDSPVQSQTVTTFTSHADASAYLRNWLSHRIDFLTEYFSNYV